MRHLPGVLTVPPAKAIGICLVPLIRPSHFIVHRPCMFITSPLSTDRTSSGSSTWHAFSISCAHRLLVSSNVNVTVPPIRVSDVTHLLWSEVSEKARYQLLLAPAFGRPVLGTGRFGTGTGKLLSHASSLCLKEILEARPHSHRSLYPPSPFSLKAQTLCKCSPFVVGSRDLKSKYFFKFLSINHVSFSA